jgi:hypothetical protein
MYKASFNLTITGEKELDIEEITIKTRDGSDETFEFELEEVDEDEDEYEEDEAGHMWDDEAYLLAARSFISWPDSWSIETLVGNLLMLEDMLGKEPDIEEQRKIQIWPPIIEYCKSRKLDPFVYVEEQIACLADTLILYKKL